MTPKVMTMAVSASACGSGSANVGGVAVADERRVAAAPGGDEQHVGAVGQQAEADDDAAELALQQQVGADAEQRGGGGGEHDGHGVASAGSSPKASKAMSTMPTTAR